MSLSSAVFALAVSIVLFYLIPHAIRRRAVLAESTADDRFSPGLRMVSVEAPSPRPARNQSRCPLLDPVSAKKRLEAREMKRPTAPVAARMAARDISDARAKQAALIARRAAAVRRRQILVGTLLLLTVSCWGLSFAAMLAWGWALIPTAVLVAVLEAGRRVAVSYRKTDLVARNKLAALERRLRAITLRQESDARLAKDAVRRYPDEATTIAPVAGEVVSVAPVLGETSGIAVSQGLEPVPKVAAEPVPEAVVADITWEPINLPAPSYTLKASVSRPGITPDTDILPSSEKAARTALRPTRARMLNGVAPEATPAPAAPVIDIDSALARRRVSGE